MSTTDTRAAFKAWHVEKFGWFDDSLWPKDDSRYLCELIDGRWVAWQAALEWQAEAAKATGTAGEPPLANYCTGALAQIAADNPHLLEFALQLLGAAPCKECGFVKQHCRCPVTAEAARQPAPALQVKTWQERCKDRRFTYATYWLGQPEKNELWPVIEAMREEIADLRAALAAIAAPVLSDDQIEELARKHNLDGSMLHGSRMDDYVVPFARDVIAATNRSQP